MTNLEINPSTLHSAANKTILITGSARGIGAATARLFNQHNANTVLVDLPQHEKAAQELIATFPHPSRAIFVPANITVWTDLTTTFKTAVGVFGGIDVVVANAGIMESKPILAVDDVDDNDDLKEESESARVIDVNIKGTLNSKCLLSIPDSILIYEALRLALFHLKSSNGTQTTSKSVILLASTSSYFGGTGVAAYIASKHAVLGLLRAAHSKAAELGVRVNAVAPFLTPTHITEGFAERWRAEGLEENTPERVAEAVAYMALDERRAGECVLVSPFILALGIAVLTFLGCWKVSA